MPASERRYVHGYDPLESTRLQDQATTLLDLLHADTSYPAGSSVLEVGCGVGAQTITLARNSPDAKITSIDVSAASLMAGKSLPAGEGGMLWTNDRTIFERAIAFAHYERIKGEIKDPELKRIAGPDTDPGVSAIAAEVRFVVVIGLHAARRHCNAQSAGERG